MIVLKQAVGCSLDGSATVSKAERMVGGERFLVKRLHRNLDPGDTSTLEREITMSIQLNEQPHILPCEHHFVEGPYLYAIMPEVENSLYELMVKYYIDMMPEGLMLAILQRLISVLASIHELGHTHGRVCAAHIYYDAKRDVKVGHAASVFDYYNYHLYPRKKLSPMWPESAIYHLAAAPEGRKSFESDIWMVGVVPLELIYFGLYVSKREEFDNLVATILTHRMFPLGYFGVKENLSARQYSDGFVNLVTSCFNMDPANRPTAKQLLTWDVISHPLATQGFYM